jgi:hypothetical protein
MARTYRSLQQERSAAALDILWFYFGVVRSPLSPRCGLDMRVDGEMAHAADDSGPSRVIPAA